MLGGPKAAFGSAVACGILLGVFEGVGVLLGRVFSEGTRPQLPPCEYLPAISNFTHVSVLPSAGVDVSPDAISCYLILSASCLSTPTTLSRHEPCCIPC